MNGTDCPALNVSGAPDEDYDIEYYQSGKIGGNYTAVVDKESIVSDKEDGYFYDTANGSPVATRAVYGSNVTYLYQSATVNMTGTVRVAPGESDD